MYLSYGGLRESFSDKRGYRAISGDAMRMTVPYSGAVEYVGPSSMLQLLVFRLMIAARPGYLLAANYREVPILLKINTQVSKTLLEN